MIPRPPSHKKTDIVRPIYRGTNTKSSPPHTSPVKIEIRGNFKKAYTAAESLAALNEELSIKLKLLEKYKMEIKTMENNSNLTNFEKRDLESMKAKVLKINKEIETILPQINKAELLQKKSHLAIKVNPAVEYRGSPLGTPLPPSRSRNINRRYGRTVVAVGGRRTRKHRKSRSRK